MGAHEIDLQALQIGVGDAGLGQLAESGVDAVDRLAGGEQVMDQVMALGDGGHRGRSNVEGDRPGEGAADVVQREVSDADDDRGAGRIGHDALRARLASARRKRSRAAFSAMWCPSLTMVRPATNTSRTAALPPEKTKLSITCSPRRPRSAG